MQEENYKNELAISYSSIKGFKSMPPDDWRKIWITKERVKKSSSALELGSLVDDLLFNPKVIDTRYVTTKIKKPSDSVSYIIEQLFHRDELVVLSDSRDKILELAKEVPMPKGGVGWGQGKGWSPDRIYNTVISEGTEYIMTLQAFKDKIVMTSDDYMAGLMMAEKVKSSEICKPYLDPERNQFQFQIITDDDFPDKLKGCLDILHYETGTRRRVIDFKTAESAYYFEANVRKYGYLDQVTFYNFLLDRWLQSFTEYPKFEILPPINIVIDKDHNVPYIYEYNMKDIQAAWDGYFKYGKWQKGLKDIIKEIQWHVINDQWEYPMEHYLYNKIQLNLITHKND